MHSCTKGRPILRPPREQLHNCKRETHTCTTTGLVGDQLDRRDWQTSSELRPAFSPVGGLPGALKVRITAAHCGVSRCRNVGSWALVRGSGPQTGSQWSWPASSPNFAYAASATSLHVSESRGFPTAQAAGRNTKLTALNSLM
jgi:hypothetical protein